MTASTRPDMTLEQIIDKVTDCTDLAATGHDLLPVYVGRMAEEYIGSAEWRLALRRLNELEWRLGRDRWTAACWKGQRACAKYIYLRSR